MAGFADKSIAAAVARAAETSRAVRTARAVLGRSANSKPTIVD